MRKRILVVLFLSLNIFVYAAGDYMAYKTLSPEGGATYTSNDTRKVLDKTSYKTSYRNKYNIPEWNICSLDKTALTTISKPYTGVNRTDGTTSPMVTSSDYKNSGYVPCHLLPVSLLQYSFSASANAKYYSNSIPTSIEFAEIVWPSFIKSAVKSTLTFSDKVVVISGAIIDKSYYQVKTLRKDSPSKTTKDIMIPEQVFVVVYTYNEYNKGVNTYKAYLLDTSLTDVISDISKVKISLEDLEKLTSLKFVKEF